MYCGPQVRYPITLACRFNVNYIGCSLGYGIFSYRTRALSSVQTFLPMLSVWMVLQWFSSGICEIWFSPSLLTTIFLSIPAFYLLLCKCVVFCETFGLQGVFSSCMSWFFSLGRRVFPPLLGLPMPLPLSSGYV